MLEPPKRKIYFAFPDRAYHYDCAQCDALCCRGHGIGTSAKETPGLLASFPALGFAAVKSGAQGADFTNPAGDCFFLTSQNLCRVEQEQGRHAKPGVCVVFPFNDFSRFGDVVIVRPHFLCPLRLAPNEGVGRHAEIEKSILETGVLSRAFAQPGPEISAAKARTVIRREENFRDECAVAIGKDRFDEVLERMAEDPAELRRWRERVLRLWGIPFALGPRDDLDDILLALAPPLRVRGLLLRERTRLRILSLAGAYARGLRGLGGGRNTLQGTHHLIVNLFVLFRFFAHGNEALMLRSPGLIEGVEFQNPLLTFAFFEVLEKLQNGSKLFDALDAALPPKLTNLERTIFFHQLARRVRELRRT